MRKKKPDQYAVLNTNPRVFYALKQPISVKTSTAKRHMVLSTFRSVGALLTLTIGLSACANSFGFGATSWQEEALLHDGSKIIVTRTVNRGGRREPGQMPGYKEQSLSFIMPHTNQTLRWEDHYSEDIGSANFLPMLLDMNDGVAFLVAYPMGCLSYNKWDRPNPPYVIFKHEGNEWQRIALTELPSEIVRTNLVFSMPDIKMEESGTRIMTAEMIAAIIARYKQPEYRSIVREKLPKDRIEDDCPVMLTNGKGRWFSIDWFTLAPTYQDCVKVCERKEMLPKDCPCATMFEGK